MSENMRIKTAIYWFRLKWVIDPCTFTNFWHWSLHFFLFGFTPCTL